MTDRLERQLIEQVEYYRRRAPVYDAWANREGSFDRGHRNAAWHIEKQRLVSALEEFRPTGRILEIAGGTGQWTERLIEHADHLTVIDAAPEALAENRRRLGSAASRVAYHEADVFTWTPHERFDAIFFGYWLSHVPPERFDVFWEHVDRFLAPGGRVFFLDNLPSRHAAVLDPELPAGDDVSVLRPAPDGRLYRVWKVLARPGKIRRRLARRGWQFEVYGTGTYFLWGEGSRAASPAADPLRETEARD